MWSFHIEVFVTLTKPTKSIDFFHSVNKLTADLICCVEMRLSSGLRHLWYHRWEVPKIQKASKKNSWSGGSLGEETRWKYRHRGTRRSQQDDEWRAECEQRNHGSEGDEHWVHGALLRRPHGYPLFLSSFLFFSAAPPSRAPLCSPSRRPPPRRSEGPNSDPSGAALWTQYCMVRRAGRA